MSAVAGELFEPAGVPSHDELVALTIAAPLMSLDRLAASLGPDELLVWDPGELDSDGWSFVGAGEALRVEANGEDRLKRVRELAGHALARVVERTAGGVERAPTLRMFGGMSFAGGEPEGPWATFGEASFVLPRWLYGRRGERAFLRVIIGPEHGSTPEGILEKLQKILDGSERDAVPAEPALPSDTAPERRRLEELNLESWTARVDSALVGIRSGSFEKVVAARRSLLHSERLIDVPALTARLGSAYPDSARFALTRSRSVFLGATPERLVTLRGQRVDCDALAGSRARAGLDEEEGARALLASEKDRREHAPVVAGIRAALAPYCQQVEAADIPLVRTLRRVHHLWTPMTGRLARPTHVLELVEALHPTPAVCGLPRTPAFQWIAANEPEGRGWYAAPVGWFDAEGDGSFFVAIRSALIHDRKAWLYAGAGIVEGSNAVAEYEETALKQGTMLAALGVTQ